MKNFVIRYGVVGGIISITLGLINWFTIAQAYGPGPSQAMGYISIILALLCVPLGIKYYRDKLNEGKVTFLDAFKTGLGITFIFSFITFVYGILFFVFAGDSFDEWRKQGLSGNELRALELQIEQTPEFVMTPWFQGLIFFIMVFIIGMVVNLVSSLILKRNKTRV